MAFKKKFNQQDFDRNDGVAKQLTKQMYKFLFDIQLEDNPDKYKADLICNSNGALVECEIRESWKNENDFPFQDYTVAQRKLKYGSCDVVTFNYNQTLAVIASVETIFKHKDNIVMRPNRLTNGQLEAFISIPVNELQLIEINKEVLNETI